MKPRHAFILATVLALTACDRNPKQEAAPPRPVRTITAHEADKGERVTLTGHVEAQDQASLAFRIGGRMIERLVNVGDRVEAGQVIAKLDPQNEINAFRSAQAALSAARAAVDQTRAQYERQRTLLAQGHTPRAMYEQAELAMRTAETRVDDAEAQLRTATDRVSWTVLVADAPGHVTARGAEPGEVVQAGQMVVQLAREGGRDAVFDVPAQLLRAAASGLTIDVSLADDAKIHATGRVREIAPQADPVTRTFAVRVGLNNPPAEMRLGATVNGTAEINTAAAISIPASALTETNGKPAVWIVDPKALTVKLRNIEIERFDPVSVIVAHGLETGDIVVTAGVQALHPDQKVRLLGAS